MQPYQERGAKDKERYERELREYRQSKSFQAGSSSTYLPENFSTKLQQVRPEAAEELTANAGDTDHHVAAVESKPKPPSLPVVIPRPCQQTQQLVNSSQSAICEQHNSTQQDPPQHFVLSSHTGTPLPEQPLHPEKVGSEGNQSSTYSQPAAHQFMN